LFFALGFNVSMTRGSTKDNHSAGNDPAGKLMKAVRAHANSTEYVGVIIGLFVISGLVYAGRDLGIYMTSLIVIITLSRILHAIGMLTCETLAKTNPFRFVGALFTYLAGFALTITLIVRTVF
jgi:uncharacterized membrane protein YecN with MAPEG domain